MPSSVVAGKGGGLLDCLEPLELCLDVDEWW